VIFDCPADSLSPTEGEAAHTNHNPSGVAARVDRVPLEVAHDPEIIGVEIYSLRGSIPRKGQGERVSGLESVGKDRSEVDS
jgi:hypothetical protein